MQNTTTKLATSRKRKATDRVEVDTTSSKKQNSSGLFSNISTTKSHDTTMLTPLHNSRIKKSIDALKLYINKREESKNSFVEVTATLADLLRKYITTSFEVEKNKSIFWNKVHEYKEFSKSELSNEDFLKENCGKLYSVYMYIEYSSEQSKIIEAQLIDTLKLLYKTYFNNAVCSRDLTEYQQQRVSNSHNGVVTERLASYYQQQSNSSLLALKSSSDKLQLLIQQLVAICGNWIIIEKYSHRTNQEFQIACLLHLKDLCVSDNIVTMLKRVCPELGNKLELVSIQSNKSLTSLGTPLHDSLLYNKVLGDSVVDKSKSLSLLPI